jgi:hypothetical protein
MGVKMMVSNASAWDDGRGWIDGSEILFLPPLCSVTQKNIPEKINLRSLFFFF